MASSSLTTEGMVHELSGRSDAKDRFLSSVSENRFLSHIRNTLGKNVFSVLQTLQTL